MNTKLASVALALALANLGAHAQEGPFLVRVRAVNLDSANKDSTGLNLTINDKVIPELDLSYFFSPQISAELILTYPQKHTLKAGGTDIGSLKHLPPTLTAQYHFTQLGAFKPYIGAGVNYTRFSAVKLPAGVDVERNSFGLAAQAGFDYMLTKNVYLNFDVKKVQIKTDVSAGGSKIGTFKVDPLLVGAGVGYRF